MKGWMFLFIIGAVISSLGIIFYFQGQSILGPESSFMYSNPEWISYGLEISIIGIIIVGSGITLKIIRVQKSKKPK